MVSTNKNHYGLDQRQRTNILMGALKYNNINHILHSRKLIDVQTKEINLI